MSDEGRIYTRATVIQPSLFDQEGEGTDESSVRKPWSEKRKERFRRFIAYTTLIVFSAAAMGWEFFIPKPNPANATLPPVLTATTASTDDSKIDKANKELAAAGWEREDYSIGDEVDQSKDKSTTGNGAFNKKGIRTPAQMIKYLKGGTKGAKALMASVKAFTGATKDEVLDSSNWIEVQSKVPFYYPGNTSLNRNGVADAGLRKGGKGDIFLLFISPSTDKSCAVRGACANPQVIMPTPLSPKDPSKDVGVNPLVAPWKQDGGQKHTISHGDGSKIPNGLQKHPNQDAQAAIDKANADNAATTTQHEEAVEEAKESGGGTVDNNETHTVSTSPNW